MLPEIGLQAGVVQQASISVAGPVYPSVFSVYFHYAQYLGFYTHTCMCVFGLSWALDHAEGLHFSAFIITLITTIVYKLIKYIFATLHGMFMQDL